MRGKLNKLAVLLSLIVIYSLPGIVCAGSLEPTRPPTQGTMHTLDDIYHGITGAREIVSETVVAQDTSLGYLIAFQVPANKVFVLTDVIGITGPGFYVDISERYVSVIKLKGRFVITHQTNVYGISYQMRSGLAFRAGSEVLISNLNYTGVLTISGYLVDI